MATALEIHLNPIMNSMETPYFHQEDLPFPKEEFLEDVTLNERISEMNGNHFIFEGFLCLHEVGLDENKPRMEQWTF